MAGLAILMFGLPNWTSEEKLKVAAKSAGTIAILFFYNAIVLNTYFWHGSRKSYGLGQYSCNYSFCSRFFYEIKVKLNYIIYLVKGGHN